MIRIACCSFSSKTFCFNISKIKEQTDLLGNLLKSASKNYKNVLPSKHVFDFILFPGLEYGIFLCKMFLGVNKEILTDLCAWSYSQGRWEREVS